MSNSPGFLAMKSRQENAALAAEDRAIRRRKED
jgi:hypothetical protein